MTTSSKYVDSNNSTYTNPMVATNQEPTVDTQKLEQKNTSMLLKKIIKTQGKKLKKKKRTEKN